MKRLPIKAADGGRDTEGPLVAALDYLVVNPGIASIVNLSLAHYSGTPNLGAALSAVAQSSILIGGAGNRRERFGPGGADSEFPESHPDVITVGATDNTDVLGVFSDTGASVEFCAPGVDIYTASWSEPNNPTAAHVSFGTSLATPMVSGTATLCLAIRPAMTRAELIFALSESAVDLAPPGRDQLCGFGRINTHGALIVLRDLIFIDDFETGDVTTWSSSSP